jgi:hypothetical protein
VEKYNQLDITVPALLQLKENPKSQARPIQEQRLQGKGKLVFRGEGRRQGGPLADGDPQEKVARRHFSLPCRSWSTHLESES